MAAIAAAYLAYCIYHLVRGLRRDEALIDAVSGPIRPGRAGRRGRAAGAPARTPCGSCAARWAGGRSMRCPGTRADRPRAPARPPRCATRVLRFPLADSIAKSVEGWAHPLLRLVVHRRRHPDRHRRPLHRPGRRRRGGRRRLAGFPEAPAQAPPAPAPQRRHRDAGRRYAGPATAPERLHHARTIRKRLRELDEAFGLRVPVYVVLTKVDRLAGFGGLLRGHAEERARAGLGRDPGPAQGRDRRARPRRSLGRAFDDLIARLNASCSDACRTRSTPSGAPGSSPSRASSRSWPSRCTRCWARSPPRRGSTRRRACAGSTSPPPSRTGRSSTSSAALRAATSASTCRASRRRARAAIAATSSPGCSGT